MVPCRRANPGLLALLAVALVLAPAQSAHAQTSIIENWTGEGISQAIQLSADNIATWTQADQQVFLMQGGMVVTQGGNTIHATDGVVWVDRSRYETERLMTVTVYGENPITIERSAKATKAGFGYIRLTTSNRIDIKSFKSKVVQEDRSINPVAMRALANRPDGAKLPGPIADSKVVKAEATQPALPTGPIAPDLKQTMYVQIAPQPPAPGPDVKAVPDAPVIPAPPPPAAIFSPNPPPPAATAAVKPPPRISVRPRYAGLLNIQSKPIENGWTAAIITGGVTVLVTIPSDNPNVKATTLDMEADRAVIWTRGGPSQLTSDTRAEQEVGNGAQEVYLAGNVELRSRTKNEVETLRADEMYYDVRRGVAVARKAELEIRSPKLPRPLIMTSDELLQINPKLYKMKSASVFSSLLPSDPGLKVDVGDLTVEEFTRQKTKLWSTPVYDKDGSRAEYTQRIFTGTNYVIRLEDVPFFYLPYYRGDVERPLGPLDSINIGYDKIFGFQLRTTWDMYDLLNLQRPDGHRWRFMLDVLTERGVGFGTDYEFEDKNLFGVPSKYTGMIRLYGMTDRAADILGGDRGNIAYWPDQFTTWPIDHPNFRGQAFGKINVQELPDGFTVLGQFSWLTDRNFLEQYFFNTHLNEPNQDTYLYAKQQQGIWAWTLEGQLNTQPWMTGTNWLPKADGYLLGKTFLDDWLVYNGHASLGYGQLRPTDTVPFAYLPTDVRANVFRADWMQEVSVPFYLGPVKLAPYGVLDTAFYSEDVNGSALGRLYGGGGVRWNMPLSRVFPDVQSELFNLNGIYHKINFVGNYFNGATTAGVNNFPQLQRLNDDSTDQALRDIRPLQTLFNPGNAFALLTSPLFNPQNYAIRRLVDNNVDTLDNIDVVQLGINQRWQTKRGFPGNEHVIDYMVLNVDVSVFPHAQRDNFGHTFGILEYLWLWNIGDRTALTSSGWFEPYAGGPRVFDFGVILGRTDTTSFYLGYSQIDPLNSKAVTASLTYPLSAKYAFTGSTVWDFSNHISSYSIGLARMGTDVLINFGLSFNSTVNTFGVTFEIIPAIARRGGSTFPVVPLKIDPMINDR